jgi:hypothetical protein
VKNKKWPLPSPIKRKIGHLATISQKVEKHVKPKENYNTAI